MPNIRVYELHEKRDLRKRVMMYFAEPKLSRGMVKDPIFADGKYTNRQIKTMVWSCDLVGLIHRIRGEASGSVYGLTDDGQLLMDAMTIALRNAGLEEFGDE